MLWTGGCLCGRRHYQIEAEPVAVGLCHCTMCRKATGGPFAVLVRLPHAELRWTNARPAIYRSSPIATRGFCPDCGTPLYLNYDDDEFIRLTVGSFDHPERLHRPEGHYGVESRISWVDCWNDLPGETTKEVF
ncbi:GFA family protein [Devosia sp. CAU 1758]